MRRVATLGLPTYLRGRAERRSAAVASPSGAPAVRPALTALTDAIGALEKANADLRAENERLRARSAEAGAASGRLRTDRAAR